MGLLVALLSLVNIALGYGLAVYLRRASPTTTPLRPVAPQPEIVPTPKPTAIVSETAAPPVKAETVPAKVNEATSETQPEAAETLVPEAAEDTKAPVDEENVLAGIESFRAQLAQVKDETEGEVEAIDEEMIAGQQKNER